MNAIADSQQSKKTRSGLIQGLIGFWGRKPQQTDVQVKSERATGTGHEEAYLVRLVNAMQSSGQPDSGRMLGIGWPEEIHLTIPKVGVGAQPSSRKRLTDFFKRPVKWLRVVILLTVLFWCICLGLIYVYPQKYPERLSLSSTHWLSLTYPEYIAVGDQGYMRVTISNEADRPLSSKVVIDFRDADHIVCMNCTERNEIEFKDLAPHARQTWRIGFVLNEAPSLQGFKSPSIQFVVRVADEHGKWKNASSGQIYIAPLPYLRTVLVSAPSTSGGILGGVLVLLFSLPSLWLKKGLGPEGSA